MTQVPGGQLSLRERARCHEVIRAQFGGYERCHRNTGHEPLPHHVRGRSWSGAGQPEQRGSSSGWAAMTGACSATRCRCGAARVKPLRRRVGDGGVPADSQPQRIGSPAKSACRATPRAACGVRRPGPALLSCRFMARACPLLVL